MIGTCRTDAREPRKRWVALPGRALVDLDDHQLERQLTEQEIAKIRHKIAEQVSAKRLPRNLRKRVAAMLAERPELPWDLAVAQIILRRQP
jgi:hypothetical protein